MPNAYPRQDGAFRSWTQNFAQQISADPARFALNTEQAQQYAAAQAAYADALRDAVEPSTRGVRTVMLKNQARKTLEGLTRRLARLVRAQLDVSAGDLQALGLLRGEAEQERSADEPPLVRVRAESRRVEVRLEDAEGRRRRPRGTSGAVVRWYVGASLPQHESAYRLALTTTKTQAAFDLPPEVEPGATVWVSANWLDTQLRPGPDAVPVSTRVGFGYEMRLKRAA